jgi:hypothetical protein
LSKKVFSAQQWFQKELRPQGEASLRQDIDPEIPCPKRSRFPSFSYRANTQARLPELSDRFSPLHCFVPGWKGDSLQSKTVMKFDRLLIIIQQDVKNELFKTKDFPKSIKQGLYNEFLSFAENAGLHFEGLEDLSRFWQSIDPLRLAEDQALQDFVDIYANRVATITFFKLRFISSLLDSCGIALTDKALLYPTSFLSQIFKTGSQTELKCRALESNLYSWYRPHEGMKEVMKELLQVSQELNITEITKNVSLKTQPTQDQQKIYSHALSHVGFGLFLNSLQVNLPLWLETIEAREVPQGSLDQERVISCKYAGDYLESLSLSHWLAQENNRHFRWNEILCPDFKGREFFSGTFTKICNELQFLTFLAQKSKTQGEPAITYICRIMGDHFKNRKNSHTRASLLLEDNPFYTSTYDRVMLNLCHFPKNNPQHFLMTQILDQVQFLKPDGYLFVVSSKKLFVPSLSDRLAPVLNELKTEAIFDLDQIKGKGELGSYIYVFRKKRGNEEDKQLCSYFRISANLESFQQFSKVTEHLRTFYLSNLDEAPTMSRLDFPDTFEIEYFQEAIVNGLLIHSTNEDSGSITHPSYFKGLLENCVPLEKLFEIRSLSHQENNSQENSLNLGLKRDLNYFLVVDFRQPNVALELHPMEIYRSIFSDYGQARCSYFQLMPKIQGINPNILRNYFKTTVGQQVAHLTFTGGPSMVKGSLSKFMVPKFFMETETLPDHLRLGLKTLDVTENELLESSPETVLKTFNHIDQITRDLFPRYACEILSRFSQLERTLESLIWKMDDGRYGQKISFNNPVIEAKLVQRPTRLLYPGNEDVFVEIVAAGPNDLHLSLTQTQLQISHEGDLKLYSLDLMSEDQTIVRLHSDEIMLLFIQYILNEARGVSLSKLLRAIHLPALSDLKEVIDSTQNFKSIYQDLLNRTQKAMMDAYRLHVTPKRKS